MISSTCSTRSVSSAETDREISKIYSKSASPMGFCLQACVLLRSAQQVRRLLNSYPYPSFLWNTPPIPSSIRYLATVLLDIGIPASCKRPASCSSLQGFFLSSAATSSFSFVFTVFLLTSPFPSDETIPVVNKLRNRTHPDGISDICHGSRG